ncbi:MAG: hypothetical protein P8Q99_00430 [Paracoccaceae bacterium]|nr:hypothetical protein [Paracoccaceae bacterium]
MKHSFFSTKMIACMLAGSLAGPVLADANIGGKTIDCYCTDTQGARVELGESICLFVDGKAFMAKCDMSLNVPIWRRSSEGCATSFLDQAQPLQSLDPGLYTGVVDPQVIGPES